MAPFGTLVVLTRYPEPGCTKTRLVPAVGPTVAARIHRELAGLTVLTARVASFLGGLRLEVHGTGAPPRAFRRWLGPGPVYAAQARGDLGARMEAALHRALERYGRPAVIVGTDCPTIEPTHIAEAFRHLETSDVVVGPARDGGYYLVGLRRPVPEIFRGIAWGTDSVLRDTLGILDDRGTRVVTLPTLRDIDGPRDLAVWHEMRRAEEVEISVIIPALNEAPLVGTAIESALGQRGVEVIVVDGGSNDGTAAVARSHGATVVDAARSRALQQNLGALSARGKTLLFLHADARLPEDYRERIREALATPGVAAGAFRLRIDGARPSLRVVEWTTDLRCRLYHLPYGDQALFLARSTFAARGGFALQPIMEDFELVTRLRRDGKVVTSRSPTIVSSRRWDQLGFLRTTVINKLMVLGYRLGVPVEKLARLYRGPG